VWLSEILRDVVLAVASAVSSGIFILNVVGFYVLISFVFVIIPLTVLFLFLLNPKVMKAFFATFGVTEELLEKEKASKEETTEKQPEKTADSKTTKKQTRNDSGKWAKGMFILGLLGLTSGILTSSYSFVLTQQAISMQQTALDLQKTQENFTSIIVPTIQQGHLDENDYYYSPTTSPIILKGWLNGSITVISPHYGNLTVEILNFTVNDFYNMTIPEKLNLTTVDYTPEYRYSTHVHFIDHGLSQSTFSINLQATFYPKPEKLPSESGNFTEFPIGVLFLQANLLEPQTNVTTTQVFSSIIFVYIRVP
jgi:hypothetical protein